MEVTTTKLTSRVGSLDVTDLFDQDEWDNGRGPLSSKSLSSLGIEDITGSHPALVNSCGGGDIGGYYVARDGSIWRADFVAGDEIVLNQISSSEIKELKDEYDEQSLMSRKS